MAVGPEDHEIFEIRAIEIDRTVDEVGEHGPAFGHEESNRARLPSGLATGDLLAGQGPAATVVPPCSAGRFRCLATRADLGWSAVAVVGVPGREERRCCRTIALEAFRLTVRRVRAADAWPFVPVQ